MICQILDPGAGRACDRRAPSAAREAAELEKAT